MLMNKRLIIFKFFTYCSKAGMVILVVKPWEAIKVHVSMDINVLDIRIESYGHVLGSPSFFFSFGKNNFSHKLRLFFNSLIGKIKSVIIVWSRVRIYHEGARFHSQSTHFNPRPTFLSFRVSIYLQNWILLENGEKDQKTKNKGKRQFLNQWKHVREMFKVQNS